MFTKEMQRALEADGNKLRDLTGEDHGPYFDDLRDYETCAVCNGFGTIDKHRPQHDDPEFCEVIECLECTGSGFVLKPQ